jgi:hypothetical protein
MTELFAEITERASRAAHCLLVAREAGDDFLASVHEAELEGLARVAAEHGLRIPLLEGYTAA